jgi:hypothetical protein
MTILDFLWPQPKVLDTYEKFAWTTLPKVMILNVPPPIGWECSNPKITPQRSQESHKSEFKKYPFHKNVWSPAHNDMTSTKNGTLIIRGKRSHVLLFCQKEWKSLASESSWYYTICFWGRIINECAPNSRYNMASLNAENRFTWCNSDR